MRTGLTACALAIGIDLLVAARLMCGRARERFMSPNPARRLTIRAFDPPTGECEIHIQSQRIITLGRISKAHTMEAAFLIPEILQEPRAIFEGLRMESDERGNPGTAGWRCYCGIPSCSYDSDGIKRPPQRGRIFLVFVNHDRDAFSWRWEHWSEDSPGLPINHANRFQEMIYDRHDQR